MNKRVMLKVTLVLFLGLLVTTENFAHSGRTDSNGGHWDYSTGTYHYHNGGTNQDLSDEETEVIFTDTADYTEQIESLKTQVENLEENVIRKESSIEELKTKLKEKTKEIQTLEDEKSILLIWAFAAGIAVAIILYNIGKTKTIKK